MHRQHGTIRSTCDAGRVRTEGKRRGVSPMMSASPGGIERRAIGNPPVATTDCDAVYKSRSFDRRQQQCVEIVEKMEHSGIATSGATALQTTADEFSG